MSPINEKGRNIAFAVGAFEAVKLILNMILGGGFDIIAVLILAATFVCAVVGLKYSNYVIAGLLALIMAVHLPDNINNFSDNWIYLLEGIIDLVCAFMLCFNTDVKEQFSKGFDEIGK